MAIHQNERTALILYGSETGNSQNVAEELERITERLRFSTRVVEMDAIEVSQLKEATIVIFAISTTGQGDIPANARKFWKSLLRKRLPPDYLAHVNFTSFGLGDSSYPKFNWAARKLHKRLEQLGAKEFYPRGEADEQHAEGNDGTFLPWSLDLRKHLLNLYPLPDGIEPIPEEELLIPKWKLDIYQPESSGIPQNSILNDASLYPNSTQFDSYGGPPSQAASESPSPRLPPEDLLPIPGSHVATLESNARLTPESHWQDVRHLKFSIPGRLEYMPGDILTIFPKNFPEDVDTFIKMMDWTEISDRPIAFHPSDPNSLNLGLPPISHLSEPPNSTLRNLLTNHLDINTIPRRSFFATIALLASDETHKERLLEFANPIYTDELYDYTTRPRRSILEVLSDFPSVKIPWQWAASLLPSLRPRQFSIASGGALKHPTPETTNIELLVAIVKYRTVIKKIREGVCTRYLAHIRPGARLNVIVTKGGMGITKSHADKPIVMIGPGTGVAPMRSLIQERALWSQELEQQQSQAPPTPPNIGDSILFYGSRSHTPDFFFSSEWTTYISQPNLPPLTLITAFSRDQPQKIYVQDRIRENAELVYKALRPEAGGIVIVCGSSGRMPSAVREALIGVFVGVGGMGREGAEAYLGGMERGGRYVQETW